MDHTNQPSAKYDNHIKWGGAAVFVVVVAIAGYVIYQTGTIAKPDSTASKVTTSTATSSSANTAAKGTAAPAQVTSSSDLTAADQSLDSSDVDSTTSDLTQNDSDLASF